MCGLWECWREERYWVSKQSQTASGKPHDRRVRLTGVVPVLTVGADSGACRFRPRGAEVGARARRGGRRKVLYGPRVNHDSGPPGPRREPGWCLTQVELAALRGR